MPIALINGRVLLDDKFVEQHAVVIDGDVIAAITPINQLGALPTLDLQGDVLLPGFIDVQVNGGGGVLFNDSPSVESIRAIAEVHRRFGTTGFLPTIISDDLDVIAAAIAATAAAITQKVPGVLGLHIEGPFLNPDRRGVHDASKFRSLDEPAFKLLTSLQHGKTLVTLAPETTTPEMIRRLRAAGIVISAGHTNAQYEDIRVALAAGLTGFTHLFNAMSPLTARKPGVVGAALEDQSSWCSIIVDGHHIDPVTLKIALRCKPANRFMLITDAMPSVGADQQTFHLQGRLITVQDGMCRDEAGTLAGSHLDMASAVRNAVKQLDIDLALAARMASQFPAEFLNIGSSVGRIAPGYRANLVRVNSQLQVHSTWIDGAPSNAPSLH